MFGPNHITEARRIRDEQRAQFDAMSAAQAAEAIDINPIDERAATHATVEMRLAALKVVFTLVDLLGTQSEDDVLPNEMLDDLTLSVFSDDEDEEDDEVDDPVKATLSAHIADALSSLGVDDDLIADVFSTDFDRADTAIQSAADIVLENMPADGDELDSFIADFAYGAGDTDGDELAGDEQFDGFKPLQAGKMTAKKVGGRSVRYTAIKAIRNGKKVVINKRIGGKVKLSSKQKAALKKARMKAGSGSALRKRLKSFAKGMKLRLHKD